MSRLTILSKDTLPTSTFANRQTPKSGIIKLTFNVTIIIMLKYTRWKSIFSIIASIGAIKIRTAPLSNQIPTNNNKPTKIKQTTLELLDKVNV